MIYTLLLRSHSKVAEKKRTAASRTHSPTESKMNFGANTPQTMRCLACREAQAITAIVQMQEHGGEGYVEGVYQRCKEDGEGQVRRKAVEALGLMGSKQYADGILTRYVNV